MRIVFRNLFLSASLKIRYLTSEPRVTSSIKSVKKIAGNRSRPKTGELREANLTSDNPIIF